MNGGCDACPFRAFGARYTTSRGPERAGTVIVGEGPGVEEAAKGAAFVGPSGRLLQRVLGDAGIDSADVLFTNAVQCWIPMRPSNTLGLPLKTSDDPEAINACHDRLVAEITTWPRDRVLVLGNTAAQAVGIAGRIGSIRGAWHDSDVGPVMPSWHPAHVLRNASYYPQLRADMAATGAGYVTPADNQVIVCDDADTVRAACEVIRGYQRVAGDIETGDGRILALGVCGDPLITYVFPDHWATCAGVKAILEDSALRWTWHNGKYDTSWLIRAGIDAFVDDDTMLLHYAAHETTGGHDLKTLAQTYLGATKYANELRQYINPNRDSFALVPRDVLYAYLGRDCAYTRALYDTLERELSDQPGPLRAYRQMMLPASAMLTRAEMRGIMIDTDGLGALEETLNALRAETIAEFEQIVAPLWDVDRYMEQMPGVKARPAAFNYRSSKHVGWVVYHRLRLRVLPDHAKEFKTANTAKATLEMLQPHPFVTLLLTLRNVDKMIGTYVTGLRKFIADDGAVHTTFFIHGSETGRLSARRPNVMNLPRKDKALVNVKLAYRARPGYVLLSIDYSQNELRTLAVLAQDDALATVYRNGLDLHDEVARTLYGDEFTREDRQLAKNLNFGVVYGISAQRIARTYRIPESEAQRMIDAWFERFARARAYIQWCRRQPRTSGVIETPFGRRRRWGFLPAEDRKLQTKAENEAANFPVQSVASDFMLLAALYAESELINHGCYLINFVHDALLVEVPDNETVIDWCVGYLDHVMTSIPKWTLGTDVPFKTDAEIGANWGTLRKYTRKEVIDVTR